MHSKKTQRIRRAPDTPLSVAMSSHALHLHYQQQQQQYQQQQLQQQQQHDQMPITNFVPANHSHPPPLQLANTVQSGNSNGIDSWPVAQPAQGETDGMQT